GEPSRGCHYHFAETNAELSFDRERAMGMRLDMPAGTAVRFEPGQKRGHAYPVSRRACGIWISPAGHGQALKHGMGAGMKYWLACGAFAGMLFIGAAAYADD